MAEEITVQLYPAAGGGVEVRQSNRGETIVIPIPFLNYERVQEIIYSNGTELRFIVRDGSHIETNIPYLIKRTNVPEGNA